MSLKGLLKDTMVYGLSTVLGKFLNWMLTFLYVRVLLQTEFGVMTKLYAYTALLMIILTYGMETGFFRFSNKHERPLAVYATCLKSVGFTSTLFVALIALLLPNIASALAIPQHPEYVMLLAVIIAMDAFMAIPLAYLRQTSLPWRFFMVRMSFIGLTILLTLIVFLVLPHLFPSLTEAGGVLSLEHRLGWVFGINLIGNIVQLLLLMSYILKAKARFEWGILRQILPYALPIMLLGLAGSFNNQADKILFPMLFDNPQEGDAELGIYAASYKLALVMVLFTQAFRYAYDPFIFAQTRKDPKESKKAYALSMRYYILTTLIIFLGVMTNIDVLKLLIPPSYYPGLAVVPYVMLGQLLFGIYFNLSIWYKVTDRTYWGAILSLIGCAISVIIIVLFARSYGFMACAWASLGSNLVMMLLSYLLGRRYYAISYPLGAICRMALGTFGAYLAQYLVGVWLSASSLWLSFSLRWLIFVVYLVAVAALELKAVDKDTLMRIKRKLPIINRL